jgi:Fic family protein
VPTLFEKSNPELYRTVKDRNLEQQYFLLQTVVDVALEETNFRFTPDVLFSLHSAAATFLDHSPGKIRSDFVHIENSKHVPPDPHDIKVHLNDFFKYLNDHLESASTFHLAAYALWRITWIHPFFECNGRTARTFCYLIICIKEGFWLPGDVSVHTLISERINEYYEHLAEADLQYKKTGAIDVSALERYLTQLTFAQIELPPGGMRISWREWLCNKFC